MHDDAADEYSRFLPEIDINDGLKRVMNKKQLLLSLLGKFRIKEMVTDLVAVIRAEDHKKIMESAHAIKGAAGNLGCTGIRDIMMEVESRSREYLSSVDLLDVISEISEKTEQAIAELLAMPTTA